MYRRDFILVKLFYDITSPGNIDIGKSRDKWHRCSLELIWGLGERGGIGLLYAFCMQPRAFLLSDQQILWLNLLNPVIKAETGLFSVSAMFQHLPTSGRKKNHDSGHLRDRPRAGSGPQKKPQRGVSDYKAEYLQL